MIVMLMNKKKNPRTLSVEQGVICNVTCSSFVLFVLSLGCIPKILNSSAVFKK